MDAPGHRDEVGQEVDPDGARVRAVGQPGRRGQRGQLLLDLGDVAVAAEAVRPHALVDLAEQQLRLRVASGARDAALGVDHEVADEARPGERRQRQEGGRRVAARRADDPDRRLGELPEARAGGTRAARRRPSASRSGARVLEAVPARIVGRVVQPEIRPEVDDRRPAATISGTSAAASAVREREEHGVGCRASSASTQMRRGRAGGDGSLRPARPRGRARRGRRSARPDAGRAAGPPPRPHTRSRRRRPRGSASGARRDAGARPAIRLGRRLDDPRSRARWPLAVGRLVSRSGWIAVMVRMTIQSCIFMQSWDRTMRARPPADRGLPRQLRADVRPQSARCPGAGTGR